ncbi:MAG: hypothetical protein EBU90_09280 [Proteobacteria bacterium]|nr:hypothetical protein [Pseudomonadota bacterium]NBP13145.1 hypothetical protein [bacterium]
MTSVASWVRDYLVEVAESHKTTPPLKYERDIVYDVVDSGDVLILRKRYRHVNKGYVYNSYTDCSDTIVQMRILEFNGNIDWNPQSNSPLANINDEINNRVLKQLDKDSLYQITMKIHRLIKSKKTFTPLEYTGIVMEVIREFKKELYSSIAKRLKRFGKRDQIQRSLLCTQLISTCKLEAEKPKCE